MSVGADIFTSLTESVDINEKNLDSTNYRDINADLGTEPRQFLRILHTTSLGLLRDICIPCLPSARNRKARLGMGTRNHGFGL